MPAQRHHVELTAVQDRELNRSCARARARPLRGSGPRSWPRGFRSALTGSVLERAAKTTDTQVLDSAEFLESVKFDAQGLVTAVVQDANSLEVLMVAWMN